MTDLETVYRDYKDKVFAYLLHKTNVQAVAEDLCSEVFLKISEHLNRYDESKASLSTWIYQITRNTLFDYFRVKHDVAELGEEVPSNDDFVEEICTEETLSRLADALTKLPARESEIVIRHYYNGENLKDVAKRLDVSYSYVKILHQSALNHLKVFLQNE